MCGAPHRGQGVALSTNARGIADELVASGTPVPELRFFANAGVDLARLPSRFRYLLVTPQYETERVLEERARSLGARRSAPTTACTTHGGCHGSTATNGKYPATGTAVVRGSGALLRIGLTGPPALVATRNLLATVTTRTPVAARFLAGALSGISISYPAPPGAHPLTGKRAADLRLTDGRRLYEALRSGRFLLAAGSGALPPGATAGYHDRVDAAAVARPARTATLIRPDAYIAWADGPAPDGQRIPEIRRALARHCGHPDHAPAQP